jgi:hypothetical protein
VRRWRDAPVRGGDKTTLVGRRRSGIEETRLVYAGRVEAIPAQRMARRTGPPSAMWASEGTFRRTSMGRNATSKGAVSGRRHPPPFRGEMRERAEALGVRTHAGTLVRLVKQARRGSRWVRERTCRDVGCTCRRRASTDAMSTSAWEAVRPKRAKCELESEADARRPGSLVRVALTRRTAAVLARRSSVPGGRGLRARREGSGGDAARAPLARQRTSEPEDARVSPGRKLPR